MALNPLLSRPLRGGHVSIPKGLVGIAIGILVLVGIGPSMAQENPLPKCPVMQGDDVEFTIYEDTQDGRLYFASNACKSAYLKHPERYSHGAGLQKKAMANLEKVQLCCPVSGKEIDPDFKFNHEGTEVGFCCGNCCAAFAKAPGDYTAQLAGAFTYQTKCPVSGAPIDPKVSTEVDGGKVYFCCGNCCAAFVKEPQKYAEALRAQGYTYQLAAVSSAAPAEPPASPEPDPETLKKAESAPEVEAVAAAEAESAPAEVTTGAPPCAVNPSSQANFAIFEITDSGPVYFCCEGCRDKFRTDAAAYSEGVAGQQAFLARRAKVQLVCPVSGKPFDPEVKIDHEGTQVAFCCGNCCAAFSQEPEKFAGKLAESFTYQTLCPVSGAPIDSAVSAEVGGAKVFFCCPKCCAKFQESPAEFAAKLKEQGYTLKIEG
jgi:YHS domain-containing protein